MPAHFSVWTSEHGGFDDIRVNYDEYDPDKTQSLIRIPENLGLSPSPTQILVLRTRMMMWVGVGG